MVTFFVTFECSKPVIRQIYRTQRTYQFIHTQTGIDVFKYCKALINIQIQTLTFF